MSPLLSVALIFQAGIPSLTTYPTLRFIYVEKRNAFVSDEEMLRDVEHARSHR